ncbi:MAG: hypothetical protein JWM32_2883 [Verrucomicrobia bacterium]|nr:hypothetical protein [Verrucomicrobiota bacterium]
MKTAAVTAYDSAVFGDAEPISTWTAFIVSMPEPALLSRVLQKAVIPETHVLKVRYDAGTRDRAATVHVWFKARPAWARSLQGQWEKLVMVERVTLTHGETVVL